MKLIAITAIWLGLGGESARRVFILFQCWQKKCYTEAFRLSISQLYFLGLAFSIIAAAIFLPREIGYFVIGAIGFALVIINVMHLFFPGYVIFPCVAGVGDKIVELRIGSDEVTVYKYGTYSLLYIRSTSAGRLLPLIKEYNANAPMFIITQLLILSCILGAVFQITEAFSGR
jgi:hypothetical protein